MDRRNFVKAVLATGVAGAAAPMAVGDTGERSYDSETISVRLLEEESGKTAVLLTEHGDADNVVVEAFYWTKIGDVSVLLHKEATTSLVRGMTVAADLPMAMADIVYMRVKELRLLTQSEFGKVPK